MDFDGKCALVTGAASGIGRATARLLVQRGARVVAADIDAGGLHALEAELGGAVIPHTADLEQPAQVEAMVAAAVAALGGLDVLVSNAGVGAVGRAGELDPAVWRRIMAIDLDAAFLAARAALPALIARRGAMVFTASVSGMAADYGLTPYNVAKAGLIGLVRNLAVDYAAEGVRVNAISPGYTSTPPTEAMPAGVQAAYVGRVPMGRAGRPEEIAEVIAFLASERASYLTGQNIAVDGGLMAHTGWPDPATLRAAQ